MLFVLCVIFSILLWNSPVAAVAPSSHNLKALGRNSSSLIGGGAHFDLVDFERYLIETDKSGKISDELVEALENEQDYLLRKHRKLQEKKKKTAAAQADKKAILTLDPTQHFSKSPFNGTDIISHPIALIRCSNQTLCIQPQLQLQAVYKAYYCKHVSHGVRFYFLIREALLLHPNIVLVETPEEADVIVYLPESAVWHKTECAKPAYKSKTIVLDETDGPHLFEPDNTDKNIPWLMYFKRSYVRRGNGVFKGYMGYLEDKNIFPMTYTIVEAYVRNLFNTMSNRNQEIVCTLRGSNSDPVRLRVRQWVDEYAKTRELKNYVAGQVNSASRTVVSMGYFEQMYKARIIVTSNPSGWEGDFRLMEALASGALIFVDDMYVPRPRPLMHSQHIVYYDNMNKTDLFSKLDSFRKNVELSRRVAVNGYLHAMKYHRAANMADYVFRTLHARQLLASGTAAADIPYSETGIDMRAEAVRRQHLFDLNKQKNPHALLDNDFG